MKLLVKESKTVEVEVDVTFPIYRKHDLLIDEADIVLFIRENEDGAQLSIRRSRSWGRRATEYAIEIEHRASSRDNLDYALGRGDYALTEAEFLNVLTEASSALAQFGLGLETKQ